ncbi:hypothetical protein OS493_038543 [Desmophyllum pertusum]|uniref:C2H2-type domain-containing protein n=1 Tax=Desmophyllum pertusum TaxID=174260 RepID=A0A9W9ZKV3_9CNID|nr:hypothetical protein OS493_038543 [Desmophyllum pertusum]
MRLALMFLIQRRRHYDKATLCQRSDYVHHKSLAIPSLNQIEEQWLNELTEKKVEVFHSLLRRSIPPTVTAAQVQEAAKCLNVNRFIEGFCTWFLPENPRGRGVGNLQELSNRAAEFLLDLFISVKQNLGNSVKIPKGHRKHQPYYLPSLDATVDQRSLPLGYAWKGLEPDPLLACDAVNFIGDCNDHGYSMNNQVDCSICSEQLPLRVEELSNSFNKGLLAAIEDNEGGQSGGDDDSEGDSDNSDDDNDDDDNDGKLVTLADRILVKAKECLAHLPETQLFKFSNRNCKPGNASSGATAPNVAIGLICVTCGRVCKTKGGLTQHQRIH